MPVRLRSKERRRAKRWLPFVRVMVTLLPFVCAWRKFSPHWHSEHCAEITLCQQYLKPSQKREGSLSTCDQQCIMSCQETQPKLDTSVAWRFRKNVIVSNLLRRGFISITVLIYAKTIETKRPTVETRRNHSFRRSLISKGSTRHLLPRTHMHNEQKAHNRKEHT